MNTTEKTAIEAVDYTIDYAGAFGNEAITSSSWSVPDGLVMVDQSHDNTSATVVLTNGQPGRSYIITNTVLGVALRLERSIHLRIVPHRFVNA